MEQRRVWLSLVLMLLPAMCLAEQNTLASLRFLTGRWTAADATGWQEETWSPAQGGNVIGTFRVVKDNKAVFFEFWSVEERDGGTVMLLKHFNAGLKGWEEKDAATVLPLVKSSTDSVQFQNGSVSLLYERQGDSLTATVTHRQDGKATAESFRLRKAPGDSR